MSLNEQQKKVIQSILDGKSIFLSGAAGTGKTHTIHEIMEVLPERYTGLTATTGMAALLIGGRTVHSFLGIGLGEDPVDKLFYTILHNKMCYRKLLTLRHLIIDEVSMLSAELLDKISELLKRVKQTTQPFGGVQMIFAGDFYQLPPVKAEYAFKADSWKELNPEVHVLTYNYRQTTDPTLQTILDHVRTNSLTPDDINTLKACRKTTFPSYIVPTKIYAINKDVDNINLSAYTKLPRDNEHTYQTIQEKPFQLCIDAQVMVTRNIDHESGIVNGTRGCVVDLTPETVHIHTIHDTVVEIPHLEKKIKVQGKNRKIKFMPLCLAYAITVHKSQGATIDAAEIDLGSNIFEYGQAYTALSRVRSLKGLRTVSVKGSSFKNHPEVVEFYSKATA